VTSGTSDAVLASAADTSRLVDAVYKRYGGKDGGRGKGGGTDDAPAIAPAPVAFLLARPPGHHALSKRDEPMGFCFASNAAVAVAHARSAHGCRRAAVVDFDVHHGNGTERTFEADPDVLVLSCHQFGDGFYPGTGGLTDLGTGHGIGATINVPLPAGAGDAAARACWEDVVGPALDRHFGVREGVGGGGDDDTTLGLLVVSAGFDGHHLDPLGGLAYHEGTFHFWLSRLRSWAVAHSAVRGRMVVVLEGGYNPDALARSVAAGWMGLLGEAGGGEVPRDAPRAELEPRKAVELALSEVRRVHGL